MFRLIFIVFFSLLFSHISFCQSTKPQSPVRTFKMDSITLKQYYFVMLVKGDKRDAVKDTAVINRLQKGHMDNIKRLAGMGKILVAGPFDDDGNWRGIFIFDCDTKEEVESLLNTDPMIKAGRLGYEIHPWWTGMNEVFK